VAGAGSAGPASFAKGCGDVRRALASTLAQFEKAEPEGDDAAEQVGVVAALITPLLVFGMRGGPVEFHAHAVLLVEVVQIPVAGALPDSRLPARHGEPVRALDPPDIAVLKHGQGAIPGPRLAPG
jgi:hypothetical protein